MTTMAAGKWSRGRAHHRSSPISYTPGRGRGGVIRGRGSELHDRGGVIRGRGSELHGPGGLMRGRGSELREHGGHTSTTSTTIYRETFMKSSHKSGMVDD